MTSQCGPRRPNLNETKVRRRYDVACRVGTPLSPTLSNDAGLWDIGHSMSIENMILGVNIVTVLYLIQYDIILQNAIDVIAKCDRSLLQTVMFISSCDSAEVN